MYIYIHSYVLGCCIAAYTEFHQPSSVNLCFLFASKSCKEILLSHVYD